MWRSARLVVLVGFGLLAACSASLSSKHTATLLPHPAMGIAPTSTDLPAASPTEFPCRTISRQVTPPVVVALLEGCFDFTGRFIAVAFPPNASEQAGRLSAEFVRLHLGPSARVSMWNHATAQDGEKQTMVILILKVLQ
jgi:hypothetical protein